MATPPDRNLAIERLLRERHSAAGGTDAGPCIGAEELAAWLDGGLPAAEASRVESHLASCPACQALLGAFASTEPATAAARGGGAVRAILPLAAAAVLVVGVWLAGTRREQGSVSAPAERQLAVVEPSPADPPSSPGAGPAEPPPSDDTLSRKDAQLRDERRSSANLDRSVANRAPSAALQSDASTGPEPRREADLFSVREKAAAAVAPAAPAPSPSAAPLAASGAAVENAAPAQARTAPAAPQRSRLEAAPPNARFAAELSDARLSFASPGGASRWRMVGKTLEVSADGGATWSPVTGVTPAELADVTSAASPARGVGWLVGRGGLVLVTTDGQRFVRTSPPAPTQLVGVEPQDGAIAEVRASDGRAWRTVDMGRSWMPVR